MSLNASQKWTNNGHRVLEANKRSARPIRAFWLLVMPFRFEDIEIEAMGRPEKRAIDWIHVLIYK